MRFEFEHLGSTTPFELAEGVHLLGGGPDDHIRLDGLPPSLLSLRVEAQRLMVEAARTFSVNGVLVPPGVPRLVLPGEALGLPDDMGLRVLQESVSERGVGTVALLKGLLTGTDEPAPSRAATLTCLTGLDVGRVHALAEAQTDIGRGSDVALRLRDRAVSRTHARVVHAEEGFTLEDLGSPNGVFLNGQRLERRALLADGDVIEMGRSLLRFQAAVEEPPPPAPPPVENEPVPDAVQPAPTEAVEEPAPEAPPSASKPRGEWWLIGLGAVAASAGVAITWALATGS
ncbi:FHA domain-containing protein [Corallococcus macrosporus]|uniref:FHA domain-containing protein n=1 Tax=Myxococcus fulvus (strain ATCC BAA-855 / HW-1) TaxID=483219 RepID=F8CEI6_MYXFH|nr:FHA domain-containing protein [Corallococcus macrosporus]AEI66057.1 FHA domain-containing protein [Corallococcus macrosporus]